MTYGVYGKTFSPGLASDIVNMLDYDLDLDHLKKRS